MQNLRLGILVLFMSFFPCPLSAYQIKRMLHAHAKSIYEEVNHLAAKGMIEEFGSDRARRYRVSWAGLQSLYGLILDSDLSADQILVIGRESFETINFIRERLGLDSILVDGVNWDSLSHTA